jgi:AAA family ATP:ADP antiporter
VGLIRRTVCRATTARAEELPTLLLGLGYGFAIFASYSILKPLRDALALEGGVRDLPWLFTGTLVAIMAVHPLYTWLVANWSRQRFVAATSRIAALNLVAFLGVALVIGGGPGMVWYGRVFYIWSSVFNLFVLSVFWSLMADVFPHEAARRLFGTLAMGITLGGMIGSGAASVAANMIEPVWILVGSILLLEVAAQLAVMLCRRAERFSPGAEEANREAVGGSILDGLRAVSTSSYLMGIVGFMLFYTITSTFLYYTQGKIVSEAFTDLGERTAFFSRIEFAVNGLTLLCQLFATGRIMRRFGVTAALVFLPAMCVAGFIILGSSPTLASIALFQVGRRVSNYAVTRPGREVLYTVLPRDQRYKAKNLVDTVIYRVGDQVGIWTMGGLGMVGLSALAIPWLAAPLCAVWALLALWLGRSQQQLARAEGA